MNNLAISLKKFFTNKNVVTIVGVLAILVILYFLYTSTINKATEKVRVPVAADRISPQTQITSEDITFIEVANAAKPDDVIMDEGRIVGKYTGVGVTVPKGGMFFGEYIVEKEDLPGNWLTLLEKDAEGKLQIPYQFSVNLETTFGNSIQPNDYVDFYVKTYDKKQTLIFGKMLSNIKVIQVADGQGKDVFRSQDDIGDPAYLYIGLAADLHDVLKKAEYINTTQIEIIVIPHGGTLEDNTGLAVEVSSEYLRDLIQAQSVELPQNANTNSNSNPNPDSNVVDPSLN